MNPWCSSAHCIAGGIELDVRISHVDTTLASRGARTLDIRISSSVSFKTPTRPISVKEASAKNFLGYRGEIDAPISAYPMDLKTGDRLEKFRRNNGFIKEEKRALQSFLYSNYKRPCFTILQLPPLIAEDKHSFKVAFDMQKDMDALDMMCIPELDQNSGEYNRIITDWCESAEDLGKLAVPQLCLGDRLDVFEKRLDILCELSGTGAIPVVNIRYSPNSAHQLVSLWDHREDLKSIVNCSEVPTKIKDNIGTGVASDQETDLIQHGFDSVTRRKMSVSPKFIAKRNMEDAPRTLNDIDPYKMAYHEAALSIEGKMWQSISHHPECGCSVCRKDQWDRIIERFAFKDNGDISPSGMRYYSALHDHQSDMIELEVMRDYIVSDGIKEYDERISENRTNILISL